MHFAEFGVVMMLFLVGLELEPAMLWRLRAPILGLGGLQVAVTSVVIAVVAMVAGGARRRASAREAARGGGGYGCRVTVQPICPVSSPQHLAKSKREFDFAR